MSCCDPKYHTDPVVKQQMAAFEKILKANGLKDYQQDGDITALFNMWRDGVKTAVADYMEVMKATGELNELLAFMGNSFMPYFTGITTVKKRKTTAPASDYYVTVIPTHDNDGNALRLRLGVANDAYNATGTESTLSFAARKNATLAVNAGVYNIDTKAPIGVVIQNGNILYTALPAEDKYQYLAITQSGALKAYPRTTTAGQMLMEGVTDAVCIFGTLLENGVAVEQADDRLEPRQSIGVKADGTIVIITVDGRKNGEDAGISYADLAMLHAAEGSVNAWALDGGGSNSTVLRGVKQNDDIDYFDTDRKVNTFLYIAKDTVLDPDNNAGNDIGRAKQLIIDTLINKVDFYNGFIRLRGPENYYAPGIEMYVNDEAARRSKLGLAIDKEELRNSYFYISFRGENTELSNMFRIYDQGVYMQTYHGSSAERPNGPIGMMYFDESLNKPIWRGSAGWVDATGAAV